MNTETIERTAAMNTEAMVKSGHAAIAGFQELARAYQALATKNAERLGTSMQALAAVQSPAEFMALQAKLMAEAVEAAVRDSGNIATLTTAVFTAAFEPIAKPMDAPHRPAKV